MIREAVRDMVRDADGDGSVVAKRFWQWLCDGGDPRGAAFIQDLENAGVLTPSLDAAAQEAAQVGGDLASRERVIAELLDGRENPTAAADASADIRAITRAVVAIIVEEVDRYRPPL